MGVEERNAPMISLPRVTATAKQVDRMETRVMSRGGSGRGRGEAGAGLAPTSTDHPLDIQAAQGEREMKGGRG